MKTPGDLVRLVTFVGFLCIPLAATAQKATKPAHTETDVLINSAMSLEVEPAQTEYVLLAPIVLKCRFFNGTDSAITTLPPFFLNDSTLIVDSGSNSKQFNQLTMFSVLRVRFPITLESGKGIEEEVLLNTNLDKFFPNPGTYTIRLTIVGSEGKLIQSDPVELKIMEPTAIDKKAFDFIQQNRIHNKFPVLFWWDNQVKLDNGKILLEEFVSKYSESIYAEYAIYQLGNYYLAHGQGDRARAELEKLTSSKDPRIAKEARATLSDVNKNFSATPRKPIN